MKVAASTEENNVWASYEGLHRKFNMTWSSLQPVDDGPPIPAIGGYSIHHLMPEGTREFYTGCWWTGYMAPCYFTHRIPNMAPTALGDNHTSNKLTPSRKSPVGTNHFKHLLWLSHSLPSGNQTLLPVLFACLPPVHSLGLMLQEGKDNNIFPVFYNLANPSSHLALLQDLRELAKAAMYETWTLNSLLREQTIHSAIDKMLRGGMGTPLPQFYKVIIGKGIHTIL